MKPKYIKVKHIKNETLTFQIDMDAAATSADPEQLLQLLLLLLFFIQFLTAVSPWAAAEGIAPVSPASVSISSWVGFSNVVDAIYNNFLEWGLLSFATTTRWAVH